MGGGLAAKCCRGTCPARSWFRLSMQPDCIPCYHQHAPPHPPSPHPPPHLVPQRAQLLGVELLQALLQRLAALPGGWGGGSRASIWADAEAQEALMLLGSF